MWRLRGPVEQTQDSPQELSASPRSERLMVHLFDRKVPRAKEPQELNLELDQALTPFVFPIYLKSCEK